MRTIASVLALLTGLMLVAWSGNERVANADTGDVIICGRSFDCMVLPTPAAACSPTPITEIWSVSNSSTYTVAFYATSQHCTNGIPLVTVTPGSSGVGPFQAYAYTAS